MNYIDITKTGTSPSGITNIYVVVSKINSDIKLGIIKWYPNWRKYVFNPSHSTLYDNNCLLEISMFLRDLTEEHKNAKR